jgi:hypothetical protein
VDLEAALFELLAREPRDLLVLDRQDPLEHLDHRHVRAQVCIEARELDADRARADHQHRTRHLLGHHGFLVRPDVPAVGLQARQRAGACAGGQDDVLCLDGLGGLAVLRDRDRLLAVQPAMAVEHLDLVLPEQVLDAAIELARDLARALDHLREVVADVLGLQTEVAGMLHQRVDLRGAQQRLGRNAAPVQADAAQMLALDQGGLHAELGAADRGDVAARTAADHDHVELVLGHQASLLRSDLLLFVLATTGVERPCAPARCRTTRSVLVGFVGLAEIEPRLGEHVAMPDRVPIVGATFREPPHEVGFALMQRAGGGTPRPLIQRIKLGLDLLTDSRRDPALDAGPERIDLGPPVIPRLDPTEVVELQEVLDDVLDKALDHMHLGLAEILDLLGQMLDVEAVVPLEVRA